MLNFFFSRYFRNVKVCCKLLMANVSIRGTVSHLVAFAQVKINWEIALPVTRTYIFLRSIFNRVRRSYRNMLASSVPYRKIALCVILLSRCSAAFEKHWLPDLEWRTASNWADGRVPETDSRVIFPQQTRHAVGIAGADNLRLSEIDLPRQGSLVLPRNGKLQVRSKI